MTEKIKDRNYLLFVAGLAVLLIVLALLPGEMTGPDAALSEWTDWGIKYAALAVAVHKVWKLSDTLIRGLSAKLDKSAKDSGPRTA